MNRPTMVFLALLGVFACAGGVAADAPGRQAARTTGFSELSSAYVAMAIQGDLRQAPALFARSVGGGAAGAALKSQFSERFLEPSGADPGLGGFGDQSTHVAHVWRTYWRQNLMREVPEPEAGAALLRALGDLLTQPGSAVAGDASPEELTAQALERAGLNYSVAATPPWRDLFAWRRQRTASYHVELTDAVVPVEVVFMDDFLIQGWKDFASLGLAATTGWVEDGRLFCVAWAYDTDSENFAISYLKHEARHLADLERFPDMEPVELEYRAKLTELAFANLDLMRIWNDFRAKAADNPRSPHAQANWRVVRDMESTLGGGGSGRPGATVRAPEVSRFNQAATDLLRRNTAAYLEGNRAAVR